MSKTVYIPTIQGPFFTVEVNGVRYSYKSGTTATVEDTVAAVIENINRLNPVEDDPTVRVVTEIGENPTDKEVPTAKATKTFVNDSIPMFVEFDTISKEAAKSIDEIVEAFDRGRTVFAYLTGRTLRGEVLQMNKFVAVGAYKTIIFSGTHGKTSYTLTGESDRYGNDTWDMVKNVLLQTANKVEDATSETVVDTVNALIAALKAADLMKE